MLLLKGRPYLPLQVLYLPYAGKEPIACLVSVGLITLQLPAKGPVLEGGSDDEQEDNCPGRQACPPGAQDERYR